MKVEIEQTFVFPKIMLHTGETSYTKLLFYVENSLLRQKIGIPMGIDPPPFRANLFLYTYGNEYMSELIFTDKVKARHFHATKPFIDDTEFYWYLK